MVDMVLKADKRKDFIPGYIIKHSEKIIKSLTNAEDTVNKAIEESRGDVTKLTKLLDEVVEKGNTALQRLKVQVEEAQSFGSNGDK